MDYEKMLDKGIKELPASVSEKHRFEIPKVKGHLQGNKTFVVNFVQIAGILRRPVQHILKFILKELATPGGIVNNHLVLGAKVPASRINEKIQKYANEFVLCPECGKPDTKIEKDKDMSTLKCLACGAKHPIKTIL